MNSSVAKHYEDHLAPVYSWMVGDFDVACRHADSFYSEIPLADGNNSTAVDLGCGHGVHAVPIAQRGYRVLAIDTSAHLLAELETRIDELPIKTITADLTRFGEHMGSDSAALIACMGDTLTHLDSVQTVQALLVESANRLASGGLLTLSFRDYTVELAGSERFVPVRADDERIHTCFLEYQSNYVIVHDMIHSLVDSGWQMAVSSYRKLRLPPSKVLELAAYSGLELVHQKTERGMMYLCFGQKEK